MKILLYEVREDEKADIARIAKELKVEVVETGEVPSLENAGMAEGCSRSGHDRCSAFGCMEETGRGVSFDENDRI